jgi:cytochrome c-type biogenesis protein CcmH
MAGERRNWKREVKGQKQANMNMKRFILITFCLLISAVVILPSVILPVARVSAQQPTPSDDEVNAIARQLFCPICENTPLDVCPTQACHDWRELIRQMLAQGKTPDEIKQYFIDHYGARVLSEPPWTGLNWLVYVVPVVAFLLGVFLLYRVFRNWKRIAKKPVPEAVSGPEPSAGDEYTSRFEEELYKRK